MAIEDIKNAKKFTKENAKEIGARGGLASGKTKRFAKTFREAAMAALQKVTSNGDLNGREAIANSLIREAVKGNVRAAELLLKIVGEDPVQKLEVTGKNGRDLMPAKTLTKEQAKELLKGLDEDY